VRGRATRYRCNATPVTDTRPRLLILAPLAPRLDATDGGGTATAQLVIGLAARHEVTLLCVRSHEAPATDEAVRAVARVEEVVRAPVGEDWRYRTRIRLRNGLGMLRGRPRRAAEAWLPELEHRVRALAAEWRPHVIQVEFEEAALYLRRVPRGAVRVVTVLDPGLAAARERLALAHGARALRERLDCLAWLRFTRRVFAGVDAAVVLTDEDRARLGALAGETRIERIPLGTDIPAQPLDPAGTDDRGVLFFGSYPHAPNLDAGLRLAREIHPAVRAQRPDATLTLVGLRPPPELRALAGNGVEVTGEVPSVIPYLDRAAVVVAPIRLGGGMRVKVLEALAAGKAVVASPLAVEGLAVADGEQLLLAESNAEFAAAIARLLGDRELRRALAERARAWAQVNVGADARARAYEALYASLAPAVSAPAAPSPRP
jgi:glycosyltransferase involved in cell wall biosynthesis